MQKLKTLVSAYFSCYSNSAALPIPAFFGSIIVLLLSGVMMQDGRIPYFGISLFYLGLSIAALGILSIFGLLFVVLRHFFKRRFKQAFKGLFYLFVCAFPYIFVCLIMTTSGLPV